MGSNKGIYKYISAEKNIWGRERVVFFVLCNNTKTDMVEHQGFKIRGFAELEGHYT